MSDWRHGLHATAVAGRRRRVLAHHLAAQLPDRARVLDIGCGDGGITAAIGAERPDLELRGLDVYLRSDTCVDVECFDGERIPYDDGAFDAVLFVDVLHHTLDPMGLLREARRVTRRHIVLKDHTRDGFLAGPMLRLMDRAGNPAEGVEFPNNYWPEKQWRDAFRELGLSIDSWQPKLGLYPVPFDWLFGRGLHFVARLAVDGAGA